MLAKRNLAILEAVGEKHNKKTSRYLNLFSQLIIMLQAKHFFTCC